MQNRRLSSKTLWPIIVAGLVTIVSGVVLLSIEYRSGWFQGEKQPESVQSSMPAENQYSQSRSILAGQNEAFFDGELTVEVINQNGPMLVHRGYDVKVLVNSPQGSRSETVYMGDCLVIGGFSISVGTVEFEGNFQKARFLVTRLADGADTSSCVIQQGK